MEALASGAYRHKGYVLWHPYVTGVWGAFTGNESLPWFEGSTPEEVAQKIDAALAEAPDPVY